jgi:hypothetical protein
MHPAKVNRQQLRQLSDLPNIGKAGAADLQLLGIQRPEQLVGQSAMAMYQALCEKTGQRHDPCVIDVFLSIISFMNGEPARPWWEFTAQRQSMQLPD